MYYVIFIYLYLQQTDSRFKKYHSWPRTQDSSYRAGYEKKNV